MLGTRLPLVGYPTQPLHVRISFSLTLFPRRHLLHHSITISLLGL